MDCVYAFLGRMNNNNSVKKMAEGKLISSICSLRIGSDEVFDCAPCQKRGKESDGVDYCRNCKEYLCESCSRAHRGSKATRQHQVIQAYQPGNCHPCKFRGKVSEGVSLCQDCTELMCDNCIRAHRGNKATRKHVIKPIHGEQRAPPYASTDKTSAGFLPDNLRAKRPEIRACCDVRATGETEPCFITGMVYLDTGELILVDHKNNSLKLLDKQHELIHTLKLDKKPYDIAIIDGNQVIVSLIDDKKLQYVEVDCGKLKLGKNIHIGRWCWGLSFLKNTIYVTCHNNSGDGEVVILKTEGRVIERRSIGRRDDNTYLFVRPYHVAVNSAGDRLVVSDWDTHTVFCLSMNGETLSKFTGQGLINPSSLLLDTADNVFVCVSGSSNILIINRDGTKQVILSQNDGLDLPRSISFRTSDRTFVVGLEKSDTLMLYRFV